METIDQRIARIKNEGKNRRVYNDPSKILNFTTKQYDEYPLGFNLIKLSVDTLVNYIPVNKRNKFYKLLAQGHKTAKAYHLTFKPDYDKGKPLTEKQLSDSMTKAYSKEDVYS